MDTINSVAVVFLTGFIELWIAIPLGVALKLSPVSTVIFSALGSIYFGFNNNIFRRWFKRKIP